MYIDITTAFLSCTEHIQNSNLCPMPTYNIHTQFLTDFGVSLYGLYTAHGETKLCTHTLRSRIHYVYVMSTFFNNEFSMEINERNKCGFSMLHTQLTVFYNSRNEVKHIYTNVYTIQFKYIWHVCVQVSV